MYLVLMPSPYLRVGKVVTDRQAYAGYLGAGAEQNIAERHEIIVALILLLIETVQRTKIMLLRNRFGNIFLLCVHKALSSCPHHKYREI
jgi:hypothetical protein